MKSDTLVGRTQELETLHRLTQRSEAVFVLVYGRRRVGKTRLLQHWARESGLPTFYWEAPRTTADNVRASLAREFGRWVQGDSGPRAPRYDDWADVFRAISQHVAQRPTILIFDEFPWAVEADDSLPSYLKTAWDQLFANSQVKLALTGSHISTMENLLESDAPLFGRLTSKLYVRPLPFAEIKPFVPRYSAEKRMAVYASVGGIPDYLRTWGDQADLLNNIRKFFLSENSPYRNEKSVLIGDVLRRDSPDYEAVLDAVGKGLHDTDGIGTSAVLPSHRVANILETLVAVRLVERRLRASVPLRQHEIARHARYFLSDPFLRFYYRFILPNRSQIAQGIYTALEREFREQMRAFVGGTFEELCRTWTLVQARHGGLPFAPEFVGSDWGPQHQADVVAVNWREHQVFVGEAKWEMDDFDHKAWRKFLDRVQHVLARLKAADPTRKLRQEPEWTHHLILFCRHAVTPPVRSAVKEAGARIITFDEILKDLDRLPEQAAHS
jgi:AAA+ ATPase superfamily predicted ATPase